MSDKQLKNKAIKIQGKDYVLVSDRINYFSENYPNGSIVTSLVSKPEDNIIVMKATITPDTDKPERIFTDYAQEVIGSTFINKTSAMENCSTSAVGRALAYMGIGVIDSIASIDEVNKATNRSSTKTVTDKQKTLINEMLERLSGQSPEFDTWVTTNIPDVNKLTVNQAGAIITKLFEIDKKIKDKPSANIEDIEVTDQDLDDLVHGKIDF